MLALLAVRFAYAYACTPGTNLLNRCFGDRAHLIMLRFRHNTGAHIRGNIETRQQKFLPAVFTFLFFPLTIRSNVLRLTKEKVFGVPFKHRQMFH